MKITINSMITVDLGYCCEWFFFHRYKQTADIAARLGVSTRAVRYHKAASKEACAGCEGKGNCMKKILHVRRIPTKELHVLPSQKVSTPHNSQTKSYQEDEED